MNRQERLKYLKKGNKNKNKLLLKDWIEHVKNNIKRGKKYIEYYQKINDENREKFILDREEKYRVLLSSFNYDKTLIDMYINMWYTGLMKDRKLYKKNLKEINSYKNTKV